MTFTKSDIEKVYEEVNRRIKSYEIVGIFDHDVVVDMVQGVYATLMVLASNWTDVILWCNEIEKEMHLWD